jgi:heme exporter protein A
VIQARDLGRRFGSKRVIRDLDLEVRAGELLLVTGPNGSGKSTLLALMAGLLAPTEGEIEVDLPRGRIGYLAHEALVYKELTALENLDLYG